MRQAGLQLSGNTTFADLETGAVVDGEYVMFTYHSGDGAHAVHVQVGEGRFSLHDGDSTFTGVEAESRIAGAVRATTNEGLTPQIRRVE